MWVKFCDEKRKIARYSMDIAVYKSKVSDEEYDWRHSLKNGDVIDCFDNRVWQNATIVTVLEGEETEYIVGFRVYDEKGNQYDSQNNKFFGWSSQYDERIKAVSPRLRPRNLFSKGQHPNPHSQEDLVHDCNDFLYPVCDYAVPRFHAKCARRSQVILEMVTTFGKAGMFELILE